MTPSVAAPCVSHPSDATDCLCDNAAGFLSTGTPQSSTQGNYALYDLLAGFLSTGTPQSSTQGNYALYDLLAALVWIQENVRSFGGDRDHVTLMGHGHGAALVHLLALSPLTAGSTLFVCIHRRVVNDIILFCSCHPYSNLPEGASSKVYISMVGS